MTVKRLEVIKWDNGRGLEELETWGTVSIIQFGKLIEGLSSTSEDAGNQHKAIEMLAYQITETAEALESAINRIGEEVRHGKPGGNES